MLPVDLQHKLMLNLLLVGCAGEVWLCAMLMARGPGCKSSHFAAEESDLTVVPGGHGDLSV